MPLFDAFVSPRLLWPENAPWPRRRARNLLKRFAVSFPDIRYDLSPGIRSANAQALLLNGDRVVVLYGGLSRHRRVGSAGLSVALAHETGHHLGGPPFLKYYRWLSSEERATEWARTVGLPCIFGHASDGIWRRGFRELSALAKERRALAD